MRITAKQLRQIIKEELVREGALDMLTFDKVETPKLIDGIKGVQDKMRDLVPLPVRSYDGKPVYLRGPHVTVNHRAMDGVVVFDIFGHNEAPLLEPGHESAARYKNAQEVFEVFKRAFKAAFDAAGRYDNNITLTLEPGQDGKGVTRIPKEPSGLGDEPFFNVIRVKTNIPHRKKDYGFFDF